MGLADDCLFLTTSGRKDKAGGKCTGLHAESLANVMARVMEKAGVPPEFRPHSARHAGMAHGKNALKMTDDQVMARSNVSGPTYRLHYSRQVRRQGFVPPVPADSVGYADLEPEPEVELAVRQLSADYDGP
jgi:integrase